VTPAETITTPGLEVVGTLTELFSGRSRQELLRRYHRQISSIRSTEVTPEVIDAAVAVADR